jgi:hypothetical protein
MNKPRSIKQFTIQLLLLLLSAIPVMAGDISGKWSGSLEFKGADGQAQTIPAHADFRQRGDALTGTVWKDADHQFSIEKGKIDGSTITFEFKAPEGEEDSTLIHTVTLTAPNENRLEGEVSFEAGENKLTGKLALTRER